MPEEQNALEVHLQNLRRRLMVAKTRQKSVQKYLAADLTAGASADGQASVPVGTDSGPVQASLQASEAKIARLKKAIEDAEGKLREVKAAETQAAVAAPAIGGELSPSHGAGCPRQAATEGVVPAAAAIKHQCKGRVYRGSARSLPGIEDHRAAGIRAIPRRSLPCCKLALC